MENGKPWQSQIETALRSADAFVGIIHKEFNDSAWCQQEIGWAKGRELPEYFIRMGANPSAFAGSTQWPSFYQKPARAISMDIFAWLQKSTDLTEQIIVGLIQALSDATDYISAGAAAERIAAIGTLSSANWEALDKAYQANNQVNGGILPTRALTPFYKANGRALPPLEIQN